MVAINLCLTFTATGGLSLRFNTQIPAKIIRDVEGAIPYDKTYDFWILAMVFVFSVTFFGGNKNRKRS